MSPICFTKLMLKSFSVWVWSVREFSNIASTVLLIAAPGCHRELEDKKLVGPSCELVASSNIH